MTLLERLRDDLSRRTAKYEHVVVACDDLAKLLAVADAAAVMWIDPGLKNISTTWEILWPPSPPRKGK